MVPAIALVAATALGITALLGGLSEATEEPDPLGQGAVLDQGLYSTKFVESRVKVEPPENDWDEEKRFVELVFDVTNQADDTFSVGAPPVRPEQAHLATSFAGSLIKISPAFDKEAGPFAYALSKGGETGQLFPGVTSQVVVRYELKNGQQPPEKITMDVAAFEFAPDFNNNLPRWTMVTKEVGDKFAPEVKARVTLPVKEGDPA
ncbi:hypothetical protein GCM10022224_004300 [Nonomuraea antimicrobica]|uniref:DUF4352 domain-containing protein n=1 Tax=Nonomuraea antimicrobica TaxID=561173 RepID=A0ABP7B118_9ACTN